MDIRAQVKVHSVNLIICCNLCTWIARCVVKGEKNSDRYSSKGFTWCHSEDVASLNDNSEPEVQKIVRGKKNYNDAHTKMG